MKIRFITLLLIMAAAFVTGAYGQTNATFSTIDVRTRETFRGPFYIYDTTYFKPSSVNIPFLDSGEPLGWFLTTSKGAEAKLVRVTIDNLIDSIGPLLNYWELLTDSIHNVNDYNVYIDGALSMRYDTIKMGVNAGDWPTSLYFGVDNADVLNYYDFNEGGWNQNWYISGLNAYQSMATMNMLYNNFDSTSQWSALVQRNTPGHLNTFILDKDKASISASDNNNSMVSDISVYADSLILKSYLNAVKSEIGIYRDTIKIQSDSVRIDANVAFTQSLWYEDTYWDDATVSGTALAPGANAPALRTFKGGIRQLGYAPSVQNDISYGQVQFSHRMKLATDIEAHLHYAIEEAAEAGDTVVIAFEYSWADMDEAFPTTDTITTKIPVAAKSALTHYYLDLGTITGAGGDNVSSSLVFRFERLQSDPSDTYDGANEYFFLLDVDFHYQLDSPGSRDETSK